MFNTSLERCGPSSHASRSPKPFSAPSTTLAIVLAALTLVCAAPSRAQDRPSSLLGNPRTGEPARVRVAPRAPERAVVPEAPGAEFEAADEFEAPSAARAEEEAALEEEGEDRPTPLEVRNRIRALDATWGTLGASGGPNIGGAILSLVGGGIQIALGALLIELGPDDMDGIGAYFIVLGGVSIARTILIEFVLRPDPRAAAIQYQHMPDGTSAQALTRMRFGEAQLRGLAEQSLIMRIVDGSLNIAGAFGVLGYLAYREFNLVDLEWLILIGPAFSLITGIITLASPTAAEQRWQAYDEMRRRMRDARGRDEAALVLPPVQAPAISFGLAADPRGAGFAVINGRF